MRPDQAPASAGWTNPFSKAVAARAPLSTLVYRSRAVADMSPPALEALTQQAQRRNGRENITGLMLYDNAHFYQWLEGPAANVDRVMGSIYRDPRHTDIEVLNTKPAQSRRFGDWSMKLAAQLPNAADIPLDVIEPPAEIVETLRVRPQAAPVLLARLVPHGAAAPRKISRQEPGRNGTLTPHTARVLRNVILSAVLPRLAGNASLPAGTSRPAANARAADLAELLIAADPTAAMQLIAEWHGGATRSRQLFATLLEPAARELGNLWNEDLCSEVDVTLALCRLQTAVRLFGQDAAPPAADRPAPPIVLIVPEPGELHRLGAALDSHVMQRAGWDPCTEYPSSNQALQDILADQWFDVLDLSLSVAMRRDHWLPRVAETIAEARAASQNPALLVVVGGRAFVERTDAGRDVGADLASRTSANVDLSILRAISETHTVTESLQLVPTEA